MSSSCMFPALDRGLDIISALTDPLDRPEASPLKDMTYFSSIVQVPAT